MKNSRLKKARETRLGFTGFYIVKFKAVLKVVV